MKTKFYLLIFGLLFGVILISGCTTPLQIVCSQYSWEECSASETKYQTCYQTCQHDVQKCTSVNEINCYSCGNNGFATGNLESCEKTGAVSTYAVYKGQQTKFVWDRCTSSGCVFFQERIEPSPVFNEIPPVVTATCEDHGTYWSRIRTYNQLCKQCNVQNCVTVKENYQCSPYNCNPTEVCTNYQVKTGIEAPAGAKNVHCTQQTETCGNDVCEPQYGEDNVTCKTDCFQNICYGADINDHDDCTQDICDQATGYISHIPVETGECLCKKTNPDDGNACTQDTTEFVNGECNIINQKIEGCTDNKPIIYLIIGLAIITGLIITYVKIKPKRRRKRR